MTLDEAKNVLIAMALYQYAGPNGGWRPPDEFMDAMVAFGERWLPSFDGDNPGRAAEALDVVCEAIAIGDLRQNPIGGGAKQ